jgi:hypothetical protein
MSAPPKRKRRAPEGVPALSTPPSDCSDSTANDDDFDFDKRVVSQVDWSIWRAMYNGEFRLAVRCDICGRWLTDGRSKRAQRGPRCAASAAGAVLP